MDAKEKYKDILHLSRPPVPENHPRMTTLNRAKIFSPFAALRGYDEKISDEAQKKTWVTASDISNERKERLGIKLMDLKKGDAISVLHFVRTEDFHGVYRTTTGTLAAVDYTAHTLRVCGEKSSYEKDGFAKVHDIEIRFEDIISLEEDMDVG